MTVQYVEVRRALGDARVTVAGCGNGHRIVRAPLAPYGIEAMQALLPVWPQSSSPTK